MVNMGTFLLFTGLVCGFIYTMWEQSLILIAVTTLLAFSGTKFLRIIAGIHYMIKMKNG